MPTKWRPKAIEAALLWNPRAKLKVALLWSPAEALERSLVRKGVSRRKALYFSRMFSAFIDHILAILPITIMLICVMDIYFSRKPSNPGELAFGTVCAIFGLTFFSDALRVVVMPFAEHLGSKLPLKVPTVVTLMIAFALGVLCTYAEPAIASLVPLAQMVSRTQSPYLHLMLNEFRELLVGAVCIGVGSAAVLGTMRFMYGWTMKSLIFATITPTLALACYMHWGDPRLRPLLGLAWDCGAVTTGDVTVPTLLAFGMGAMKAEKKKKSERTGEPIPPPTDFEGFGLVTLASILPILTVEILAIICAQYISPEELAASDWQPEPETVLDTTPVTEILYAMRAMLPLNAALILAVLVFLREPLPLLPLFPLEEENPPPVSPNSVDATLADPLSPSLKAVPENRVPPPSEEPTSWVRNSLVALLGVLLGQIGIMLFFVGLSYAFSSLGNEVGQLLPASFLRVPQEASSPFFSYSGGVVLTLSTVGILGFLSTRAEPALNVVGATVESVSGGTFPAGLLIYSVCVGVGAGMIMGSTKMLFGVPMIIWILTKYGVALLFTIMATDNMVSMAWDSAGVTTGSVTVPFVLSIGIGFSEATFAADGFGILTSASAAPIITVLGVDFVRSKLKCKKPSKTNALAPESTKLSNREDSNALTVNQSSLYQGGSQLELESLVPQKDARALKTNQFKRTTSLDSLGAEKVGLARDTSQPISISDVPEGESLIVRVSEKPRMRLAASNESSIPEERVPLTNDASENQESPSELESFVPDKDFQALEPPITSPVTIHSTNGLESSEEIAPLVITIKTEEASPANEKSD